MPSRLKQSADTGRELRRMCRRRIRRARARLQHDETPASIHGVRKEIKRIRALLRLLQTGANREASRRIAKLLRKAAECLASSRDARVILQAFATITSGKIDQFPELHATLRQHCRREANRLRIQGDIAKSANLLHKARRRLNDLKVQNGRWVGFVPELKHSHICGAEKFEATRRAPTSENFHRWRKHVKRLWYQLLVLCPKRAEQAQTFIGQLESLGGLLGEEHDLALLKQFNQKCRISTESKRLNRLIDIRRGALQSAALKLGVALFSKSLDTRL